MIVSGGHILARRSAIRRGHARGQAPHLRVCRRTAETQHQDPGHASAAPPQIRRQRHHFSKCKRYIDAITLFFFPFFLALSQ